MDKRWKQTVYVLCIFGFFKDLRPSDSFVTEYLVGPHKNFTIEQINQDVYPAGTYAGFVFSSIVLLVTDYLQYRPIVIIEALAGTATFATLIWGKNIPIMQVAQVLYGLFTATDVAYSTYLFAAMPKSNNRVGEGHKYRRAASLVKVSSLTGRVGAAAVGQIAFSLSTVTLEDLHMFTMTALSCSIVVALLLPPVQTYAAYDPVSLDTGGHNLETMVDGKVTHEVGRDPEAVQTPAPEITSRRKRLFAVFSDLVASFSNVHVITWSLWLTLVTCGVLQVSTYVQNLWRVVVQEHTKSQQMYNGAVSAAISLLGAVAAWCVGKLKSGGAIMWLAPTCSTLAGVLCLVSARSTSLWIQYAAYGGFKMMGHVLLTLASAEVARSVAQVADCHGIVFGVNSVMALLLQSLFTLMVTGKGGFQLSVRHQYHVYGGYFIVLGVIYGLVVAIVKSVRSWPSPEDRLPVSTAKRKTSVQTSKKTPS